jgi:hypothetical protein
MEKIISISIIIHVIAGFSALLFGAIAFGFRRNTPRHKPFGKIYFWSMTVIFITGIFLSIAKHLLFFFFIAIFTYYTTLIAYRALRYKNLHQDQKYAAIDWIIEAIAGFTFLGLAITSIVSMLKTGHIPIIPLVFSIAGTLGVYSNVKRMQKKPASTNYWLKVHVGNMMGSYIGGITAFLVNQTDKIPLNPVILWLGPAVIITPVIILELRKIRAIPIEVNS